MISSLALVWIFISEGPVFLFEKDLQTPSKEHIMDYAVIITTETNDEGLNPGSLDPQLEFVDFKTP